MTKIKQIQANDYIKTLPSWRGPGEKRGKVRRVRDEFALIEWATWSYICTWVSLTDLKLTRKAKVQ